jgi:hypothetical protein
LGCAREKAPKAPEKEIAGKRGYVTKAYQKYFGTPKPIYPNVTYYVAFYSYSGEEPYFAGKVKPIAKETDIKKHLPELSVSKLLQEPPLNELMLIRLIHPKTKLIGIRIKNKTAIANFSKELLDSQVGAWGEGSIIASLTHTLCQFDKIEKVSIEIEGKSQETIDSRKIEDFLGHISLLEQPFKPDKEVVVTQDEESAITTVKEFLKDVKGDRAYKYLSKRTKEDVGTEEEFKKEKKSDLHKIITKHHRTWVSPLVTDAKFEKSKAEITITGNRTINGEYRENDKANFKLLKEEGKWRIDFTETLETTPPKQSKEEIITGPANINRAQLEQIQATVDQGHQPWRLDPQMVAMAEGTSFGFDKDKDTFTLVSKIDHGQLSGTGEALVEVVHKGITYQIFLLQPIKAEKSGIWTINRVKKK